MVNNFSNPATMQKFLNETNKALRKVFGKYIKGNFLIEMLYMVERSFPGIYKYYDLQVSMETVLVGSDNRLQFDMCKLIIGCHSSNIIFLPDEERVKLEQSDEYKRKLTQQVIQNIKLRRYGSYFFRRQPIQQGELFINYNVPYNLFVTAMRINELLDQKNPQSNVAYLYDEITIKSMAALTLLEDNFLNNCFPVCRVVIELYLKLLLCKNVLDLTEEYFKFTQFEVLQSCCEQKYPKEFNDLFKNRLNKSTSNKVHYLHYGWVDKIPQYHDIVKKQPYSINGVLTYLKATNAKDISYFEELERFYTMCHGYSHGNLIQAVYPLLNYFEISEILHYTLFDTYKLLCEELGLDGQINGIDMYAKAETDFSILHSQYMQRSTENFKNHYKKKY